MFAFDPDVAGQPAQPFWRETAPHYQAYERRNHANDHNQFAQFAHYVTSENKSAALVNFTAVL
jgi:hypothetical protein